MRRTPPPKNLVSTTHGRSFLHYHILSNLDSAVFAELGAMDIDRPTFRACGLPLAFAFPMARFKMPLDGTERVMHAEKQNPRLTGNTPKKVPQSNHP